MNENMLVIIGSATIVAIWIALKFANVNDTMNRAVNLVQLITWQAHDEKMESGLDASLVSYSPTQNSPIQKRSMETFREG